MKIIHSILDKRGVPILVGLFAILLVAEKKIALRKRVQARLKRMVINSLVAAPAFVLLRFLLIPVMVGVAIKNRSLRFGLNYQHDLPQWFKSIISFLLLDYSNYLWHSLNHRLPVLWRFHLVHHTDLDLDVTTAIRFHFGEMITSVFFRGGAVLLIGASPKAVLIYEILFEAATQFHHSNMRLPLRVEKLLNKIIVTPRMHGIHHSIVKKETDSNFSVIFSGWDRIHSTIRLNVEQNDIVIGVPSYRDGEKLTVRELLALPFKKIQPWQLPDGTVPNRKIIYKDEMKK